MTFEAQWFARRRAGRCPAFVRTCVSTLTSGRQMCADQHTDTRLCAAIAACRLPSRTLDFMEEPMRRSMVITAALLCVTCGNRVLPLPDAPVVRSRDGMASMTLTATREPNGRAAFGFDG